MNKARAWSYVFYIILYVAIFAFVGIFNLAVAQWNTDILTSAQYWSQTAINSATYIAAFQVSLHLGADLAEASNKQYQRVNSSVIEASAKVDDGFTDFVYWDNMSRKTKAWKDKLSNQLIRLNNKMPHKVLMESKKDRSEWGWRTRRWMRKKQRLKEQLDPQWIKENIEYLKVDYPKYSPQEILTGNKKYSNRKRLLEDGMFKKAFGKRVAVIVTTSIISAFLASLAFTGSIFSMVALIAILAQFILIIVNMIIGIKQGIKGFEEVKLNNLMTRRQVLVKYLSEKQGKSQTEVIEDEPRE